MADERPERPAEVDGTAHLFRALGKQIKVLREQAGLSQRELGVAAHCGEDLISAIERGVRTPQPDFLERVDELLTAGGVLKAAVEDVREAQSKALTRLVKSPGSRRHDHGRRPRRITSRRGQHHWLHRPG
ncbi:multiprotein-bridging factor 1 family protein [Streptomyces sp. NPDC019890]|uniref:helix-turn-helix domain-containing protein n=1 Tax=Streptomyces sp. NPDC019890 TaxID=3365064 RepID=UPI00384CAE5B